MTSVVRSLPVRRDHRVTPYGVASLGLVALGLMTGRTEPIAVGAACAAVVLVGLTRTAAIDLRAVHERGADRVVSGTEIVDRVHLELPPQLDVTMEVIGASTGIGPPRSELVTRDNGLTVVVRYQPSAWGRYRLGELVVRASEPGGMLLWQGTVADLGSATVIPTADRISEMLSPPATQISAGSHISRAIGDGYDFSDVGEHRPGDRLRDVNWKVSARRRERFVNRRHPERGGDVVIVLDAVPDSGTQRTSAGAEIIQRMAQAAWALARNHLAGQDRVGLMVPHGGRVAWLPPRGGARAKHLVFDQLLRSIEPRDPRTRVSTLHGVDRAGSVIDRRDIPPSALVIALSTLDDHATMVSLAALSQHGRTTSVLAFDASASIRRHTNLDRDTVRLGQMLFDARVRFLRRTATPVVVVGERADIGRSVTRLVELTRRTRAGAA